MGNSNGIQDALALYGTNIIINFKGGYFSFVCNDEIALVLDNDPSNYYILNCTSALFKDVKQKVKSKVTKEKLIKYWKEQSKHYTISKWSSDFNNL